MRSMSTSAVLRALPSLIFLFSGFVRAGENASATLAKGDIAPRFALRNLDGKYVRMSDYSGTNPKQPKVVILNFWATWCPPCMREMPHLLEVVNGLDTDKVVCFLIAENKMSEIETVRTMAKKKQFSDKVLLDPYRIVLKKYNSAQSIPITFVVDSSGQIVAALKFTGKGDAFVEDLRSAVREAFKGA